MLTKDEATVLTDRIRVTQDTLDDDIIAAFNGKAHEILGYGTWVAYATANFPKFKQSAEERLASVLKMTDAGMSTRSIGSALGVDQKTVVTDRAKRPAPTPPASAPADPAPADPTPPPTEEFSSVAAKPVKIKTKSPKVLSSKQSRKYIDAYTALVAEHPSWSVKQIVAYFAATFPALKFSSPDISRLRMWATAPVPIREAYYEAKISAAVGGTLMSGEAAKYLDDAAKITMMNKVIAGLVPTGAPAIRAAMKLMPTTYGKLLLRWNDPAEAMSYDDLVRAKLDKEAGIETAARDSDTERARIEASIKVDYGIKAEKWIDNLNAEIDLVEAELPAIMALTFQATPMAEKLEAASARLWELAQAIRNKGTRPAAKPAVSEYIVIDA